MTTAFTQEGGINLYDQLCFLAMLFPVSLTYIILCFICYVHTHTHSYTLSNKLSLFLSHTHTHKTHTVPSVAPIPTLKWLSVSEMEVSWTSLTLEEARGFPTGYTVTYTSAAPGDPARRRRRDEESGMETVSADQTSVTLTGLDSERQYSVSVAASTSAGTGTSSNPIMSPSESTTIHFFTVKTCSSWL